MTEENDDNWRKVTAVGNSWIVCKSKTHKGYVYYFNTLTGKAAWNLSAEEMQKAQTRTKTLKTKPTVCPEPQENPPSTLLEETRRVEKNVVEQPIQRQLPVNTLPEQLSTGLSFSSFPNAFCSPPKPIIGVAQGCLPGAGAAFNPTLNALCKLQALTNPVRTLNLNTNTFYNPNVWDVSQTQQILGTHTQAVTPHTSGVFYNKFQNASPSLGTRKFYPRQNNYVRGGHNLNKNVTFVKRPDLRQKLGIKKRVFGDNNRTKRTDDCASNDTDKEENSAWVNQSEESQTLESSSRLDLEPLKRLAPANCNQDAWFIVMDLDILVNEFKFLNSLTDSDEHCHLMVPHTVLSQLKEYVTTSNNVRCRRILRFLSQEIEIGHAGLAEEPSCDEGSNTAQLIYATCNQLAKRNYHLVLLTVNNELLSHKDSSNFVIFSINEVKELLKKSPSTQPVPVSKKSFVLDRLINKIKITVPNDVSKDVESSIMDKAIKIEEMDESARTQTEPSEIIQDKPTESSAVTKHTVEAAIQTDFESMYPDFNIPNIQHPNTNVSNEQTDTQHITAVSTSTQVTEAGLSAHDKKREIKLKRSISSQPTILLTESNEKRQFKWRRRRNTTPQGREETPTNTQKLDCETSQVSEQISSQNDLTVKNVGMNQRFNEQPSIHKKQSMSKTVVCQSSPQRSIHNSNKNTKSFKNDEIVTNQQNDDQPMSINRQITQQKVVFQHSPQSSVQPLNNKNVETVTAQKVNQQTSINKQDVQPRSQRFEETNNVNKKPHNNVETLTSQQCKETSNKQITHMKAPSQIIFSHRESYSSIRNIDKLQDDMNGSSDQSTCTEQNQSRANVTIDETSVSGISNSESNIDAESYSSNFITPQKSQFNDHSFQRPMFEIDSLTMEEYLKINCDEWVSRFIQIMEEVLSQVLQQEPAFTHSAMPPPWTLYEAAQCIAMKFNKYKNIKDAVYELSSILLQLSNDTGSIKKNITPYQFMQIYSFGFNLLNEMQTVISNCEDIEIAVQSLTKLLEDIRHPNIDLSTNEPFNDTLLETTSQNEELLPELNETSQETAPSLDLDNSEEPCHSPPKNRKLSDENPGEKVEFIRNIDVGPSFFSRFGFKQNKDSTENIKPVEPQIPRGVQCSSEEENVSQMTTDEQNTVPNSGPQVVRKFTICADFEKKLSNKFTSKTYEDHDEELDYEDDYEEYLTEECCSEDENENIHHNNNNANINESCTITDEYEPQNAATIDPFLLNNNDDSKKFKYLMGTFIQNIKDGLDKVRVLCNKCFEELKKPKQLTPNRERELQRNELREMAEKAHLHLIRLYRSLASMLDHETDNPSHSMCDLLKQADINVRHIDTKMMAEYRTTVANCKDHVDVFLKAIQNILTDFKNN